MFVLVCAFVTRAFCYSPVHPSQLRGGSKTLSFRVDTVELNERVRTLEDIWKAEKEEQTDRRGNTLERLTTLDGRMTAHEKTCMSALSDLESALSDLESALGTR